jgi:hypothetical protein
VNVVRQKLLDAGMDAEMDGGNGAGFGGRVCFRLGMLVGSRGLLWIAGLRNYVESLMA